MSKSVSRDSRRAILSLILAASLAPAIPLSAQDCNNNGIPDVQDIDPTDPDGNGEVSGDCNANGIPDECDVPNTIKDLYPLDHMAGDRIGQSVDIDGDTIIVSAASHDGIGENSGAAYIYRRIAGEWMEIATLTPDDAAEGQFFGNSVSVSGNTIAIAAEFDDEVSDASGAVYLFREIAGNWQQIAKLKAQDAGASNHFGANICIENDTLVVGAPYAEGALGAVYIFRETNGAWNEIAKVRPAEAVAGDQFGSSVALSGATFVAGSPRRSEYEYLAGTAYLFREVDGEWVQLTELTAPDKRRAGNFGNSVAITGDTAIVGECGAYSHPANPDGKVHVFQEINGTWQRRQSLTSEIPMMNLLPFGNALAIEGNRIFVGGGRIPQPNIPFGGDYAVAIFEVVDGLWQRSRHVRVPVSLNLTYSEWVSASGSTLVFGSPTASVNNVSSGYFNAVDLTEHDCNNNSVPDACELSGNDCNENGVPDECDPDCDSDGVPDACEIADCQNGDLSCADCNANGIPDACEPDCDADGVPDVCEIADCPPGDTSCADCDENGIPDACDNDCNENAIPDRCEMSSLRETLTPEHSGENEVFGASVDLDGAVLVSGAPLDFHTIVYAGSATILHRVNGHWERFATLHNPENPEATRFGSCVAVSGNRILVGAPDDEVAGVHDGAAYLYEFDGTTWNYDAKLIADAATANNFGRSLDIDGDTAIVGCTGDDEFGDDSGATFVFRKINGTWERIAKLKADDATPGDNLGYAVALNGDTVVAGAIGDDESSPNGGAVYVFRESNNQWLQVAKLTAPGSLSAQYFGYSVAIDQDIIAAKANKSSTAMVFMFEDRGTHWEQTGYYSYRLVAGPYFENQQIAINNGKVANVQAGVRILSGFSLSFPPILYRADLVGVFEQSEGIWQKTALLVLGATPSTSGQPYLSVAVEGETVVAGNGKEATPIHSGAVQVFQLVNQTQNCDGDSFPDECLIDLPGEPSPYSRCGQSNLLMRCAQIYYDCDNNGFPDYCGTLPFDRVAELVDAVLNEELTTYNLCSYDLDHNGLLDGRDISRFVDGVLGQ